MGTDTHEVILNSCMKISIWIVDGSVKKDLAADRERKRRVSLQVAAWQVVPD